MVKRDASCPLCGAKLPASAWLDACYELVDADLGILAARCPACQGNLEIRPQPGCLELGYLSSNGERFEVALSLDFPGLEITSGAGRLGLHAAGQHWEFAGA